MNNQPKHIVIIGAGYAGMLATVRLAGKTRRANVSITLVNAVDHFVERMRLHQLAANQQLATRPIANILRGTGVNFVQGYVAAIDPQRHEVTVQHASHTQQLTYDYLLYALGSTTDRESVPGVRQHAYTLTPNGERSAAALRQLLPTLKSGRLVVVGGGATGIEAAAEFAESYPNLEVLLMTRGEVGAFLNPSIAAYMQLSLTRLGVQILDHTTAAEVRANGIVTTSGATIPYDVCLWAGGFVAPPLARESGLTVNEKGQILVDPYMRSISHPDIYATGDAAQPVEDPTVHVRMSAFTAAILGAHAADTMSATLLGKTPKPLSFAYLGQGIALGRHDAIGFGLTTDDKPKNYYFGGKVGLNIREFFVNFLADATNYERRFPGFFYWIGKGRYAAKHRAQQRRIGDSI